MRLEFPTLRRFLESYSDRGSVVCSLVSTLCVPQRDERRSGTGPDPPPEAGSLGSHPTAKYLGIPTTNPGNHRPNGPKAYHVLTINLNHSKGESDPLRIRSIEAS